MPTIAADTRPHPDATVTQAEAPIEVVAAIIYDAEQNQVLLTLRKPEQHQGDRWEFPGGKCEVDEAVPAALIRELDEELGIRATVYAPFRVISHAYPDKTVLLHFWQVTRYEGQPEARESQQMRWVPIDALHTLTFPDANTPVVDLLVSMRRERSATPV